MNFLGGPIGNKLLFYPVFIGLLYTIYYQLKYRNVFINQQYFRISINNLIIHNSSSIEFVTI